MDLNTYEIVYIITYIFGTYTIYKLLRMFFINDNINKKIEILSYCTYYLLTIFVYLFINIPLFMIIYSIIVFFGLSLNYKSNIKKRLLSVFYTFIIMVFGEFIVALVFCLKYVHELSMLTTNDYPPTLGLIMVRLIIYLIYLVFSNFKNVKQGQDIPIAKWICIIFIPVSSIYIILLMSKTKDLNLYEYIIILVITLFINVVVFYLYDTISKSIIDNMEKIIYMQQTQYYEEQFNMMKTSIKKINTLKHDLTNHLFTIHTLTQQDRKEEAINHITEILKICNTKNTMYSETGNTVIDSILNFKLQVAEQNNICTKLKVKIPSNIDLQSFDMAIILGNLLDNAIEANMLLNKEERYIDITIKYDRGRLYIKISNYYNHIIFNEAEKLITTKNNKHDHGIGFESVKNTIRKYNGTLDIDCSNYVFTVKLMFFLNQFVNRETTKYT